MCLTNEISQKFLGNIFLKLPSIQNLQKKKKEKDRRYIEVTTRTSSLYGRIKEKHNGSTRNNPHE